ncbi:uncharacterized protein IWZ02DRAFT_450801 [Phyllosticta citriasiana]|uniref:Uncharacterized protein n=1 Tax=Phyllosticta citriasiana TaxID=595635 RepID=A0ABR1KT83_9PEZI
MATSHRSSSSHSCLFRLQLRSIHRHHLCRASLYSQTVLVLASYATADQAQPVRKSHFSAEDLIASSPSENPHRSPLADAPSIYQKFSARTNQDSTANALLFALLAASIPVRLGQNYCIALLGRLRSPPRLEPASNTSLSETAVSRSTPRTRRLKSPKGNAPGRRRPVAAEQGGRGAGCNPRAPACPPLIAALPRH